MANHWLALAACLPSSGRSPLLSPAVLRDVLRNEMELPNEIRLICHSGLNPFCSYPGPYYSLFPPAPHPYLSWKTLRFNSVGFLRVYTNYYYYYFSHDSITEPSWCREAVQCHLVPFALFIVTSSFLLVIWQQIISSSLGICQSFFRPLLLISLFKFWKLKRSKQNKLCL